MTETIQKKSLWQQYKMPILLLGGIAIGALIGVISPSLGQALKPLGDIFLNLMFTIVVPLVFASIATLGFLFDPAATCLNSSGDTIASMMVTRMVEGKNWLIDRIKSGSLKETN